MLAYRNFSYLIAVTLAVFFFLDINTDQSPILGICCIGGLIFFFAIGLINQTNINMQKRKEMLIMLIRRCDAMLKTEK